MYYIATRTRSTGGSLSATAKRENRLLLRSIMILKLLFAYPSYRIRIKYWRSSLDVKSDTVDFIPYSYYSTSFRLFSNRQSSSFSTYKQSVVLIFTHRSFTRIDEYLITMRLSPATLAGNSHGLHKYKKQFLVQLLTSRQHIYKTTNPETVTIMIRSLFSFLCSDAQKNH